ncbi:MAG: S41 family peptidase [Phycisphaerales bacterium]|nr:S41 family peptidase [Phycisphaerales bacterium]
MRKTGTSTRAVRTAAMLLAAIGIAGAAPASWSLQEANAPAPSIQIDATAQSGQAWTEQFWNAASDGDHAALIALLHRAQGEVTDVALADAATALGVALDENTIARGEKVAEHRETIAQTLTTIAEAQDQSEREDALMEGMSAAIALHMLADDKEAVLDEPNVLELVSETDRLAHLAEEDGRWYAAAEMFERLHALYEDEGVYQPDRQRQLKRLSLIALYAPERNHQLRSERLVESGEEPLPPYNPAGDSVDERLADVKPLMLLSAMLNADRHHVSGAKMQGLLVAGLKAVRLMAETDDLHETYPQLADEAARSRFVEALASRAADVDRAQGVTDQTLQQIVREIQSWNRQTVRLPDALVLRVFGDGAMRSLDEYTEIIWPFDVRQFERSTRGNFSGIGVSIQMNPERKIQVVTPLDGTPAQRAGVRAEDIITAVNGEKIFGISLNQAVDKITGPKGTPVDITVERGEDEDTQEVTFTIVRDTVELKTVKGWERIDATEDNWDWMIDPVHGIGYVRLTGFTENTSEDFDKAIEQMRTQNLQGLVLDLRFNRGGLLDQAVEITSRFVDYTQARRSLGRVVVSTRNDRIDGRGMAPERLMRRDTPLPDMPVVVLINEGSASASEIVAGAIQDYADNSAANAVVLGQTSYGKGSVQNVVPIDPERRSSPRALMKLTTQYYVLPGGRMIHRVPGTTEHGVVPDLSLSMLPEQVAESLILRQEADVLVLDEDGNPPAKEDRPDPSRLIDEGMDLQLWTALVLLQSQTRPMGPAAAMLPDEEQRRTP